MIPTPETYKNARAFMRKWDAGFLNTVYKMGDQEFPLGTMCTYVTTEEGEIIVQISTIALHTKNIMQNANVGFSVMDQNARVKQASARIGLVGVAKIVDENDTERFNAISERYYTFFPEARHYGKTHNFSFYTIKPAKVHYIQTFGQIYTFDTEQWMAPATEWKSGQGAVEHMNEDHKSALMGYAKNMLGIESEDVSLMAVDGEGFHMEVNKKVHYLRFDNSAADSDGLRREFTLLAKKDFSAKAAGAAEGAAEAHGHGHGHGHAHGHGHGKVETKTEPAHS